MDKQDILNAFLNNEKTLEEFFTYPTYGNGDDILSIRHDAKSIEDVKWKELIRMIVNMGACLAGHSSTSNKEAVRVQVRGLDFPLYVYMFDNYAHITTGVRQKDGQMPKEIHWRVQ